MLPLTYNPKDNIRYSVIYMTDGFMHFPMTVPNLIQEKIPDAQGKVKLPSVILFGTSHSIDSTSLTLRLTASLPYRGKFRVLY